MNSYSEFIKNWNSKTNTFTINTSGSTGVPKPIAIHKNQLLASVRLTEIALPSIPKQTIICIPITTIGGFMQMVRATCWQSEVVFLEPSATPNLLAVALDTPTTISLTTLQLYNLLAVPQMHNSLRQLHSILLGGGLLNYKIPKWLAPKVLHTYGMTETCSHIAIKNPNNIYFNLLPGVEIKLNKEFKLAIKAEVTKNEWVFTNDIAQLRGSRFKIIGRSDSIINTGGVKLDINKISAAFLKLNPKAINAFFIAALPHPILGQQAVLFIDNSIDISSLKFPKTEFKYIKNYLQTMFVYTDSHKINIPKIIEKNIVSSPINF